MMKVGFEYRYPLAFVGFGGQPTGWWTRFLKKGFYHCLIVLGNGREWVLVNPLAHYTDVIILKSFNVKKSLERAGYLVCSTIPGIPADTRWMFRPYTCVETVKRFLGIKKPFILTPYQLFLFLTHKIGK